MSKKRRNIQEINFLKRRGFLIESEDINVDDVYDVNIGVPKEYDPEFNEYYNELYQKSNGTIEDEYAYDETHGVNFPYLCYHTKFKDGVIDKKNTYCKLEILTEDSNLTSEDSKELAKNIGVIYFFLRPNKINNRSKFHRLINLVLEKMPSNSAQTFSMLADEIRKEGTFNIDKFRGVVDDLVNEDAITTDKDLEDLINKVKSKAYTNYENEFVNEFFKPNRTSLRLDYIDDEKINTKFSEKIVKVILGETTIKKIVNDIMLNIKTNISENTAKLIKADLTCTKSIFDIEHINDPESKPIIRVNDNVEVKKLDYKGDSYLSEFFSVYKTPKSLPINQVELREYLLSIYDNISYWENRYLKTYNIIINRLFNEIVNSNLGKEILNTVRENLVGIMFKNYRFVPIRYIKFYWSYCGARDCSKEKRLTIRYKLVDGDITTYLYDTESGLLKRDDISVVRENINGINKTLIKEDEEFDWVEQHLENIPDDVEIEALVEGLGADKVFGEHFGKLQYDYYGDMVIYSLGDGEEWAVGTYEQAERGLVEWAKSLIEDVGYDGVNMDVTHYVHVNEYWIEQFCQEEADYYVVDLRDSEIIEEADMIDEFEEIEDEMESLQNTIDELTPENEESTDEIDGLNSRYDDLVDKKNNLIDRAREEVRQRYYDYNMECMSDPFYCLIEERGWYRNSNELIENMGWHVDIDEMAEDLARYEDFGKMGGYNTYEEVRVDGKSYVLIRID